MNVDARSRLQVPRQERCQQALDHLRRGCDAELPHFAAPHGLCMLGELLDVGEQVPTPEQEALARACHTNSAPRTLEKPDPQLPFEVVNLTPQRRLRDAQPGRRSGEGARLGDGDEITEVAQLHFLYCLQSIDYRSSNALDSAAVPRLPWRLKEDSSC